jgi:hypothetical protein
MYTIRSLNRRLNVLLGAAVVLAAFVVGTLQRIRDRWSR